MTSEREEQAMDAADEILSDYIKRFGADEVPSIIAAIMEFYVNIGSADFARNFVVPGQITLINNLEREYLKAAN